MRTPALAVPHAVLHCADYDHGARDQCTHHERPEGHYSKLKDAEFNNITVNTEHDDGTIDQLVLPPNRQGSVYRADLEDIAFRMGDTTAEGCWLQFQAAYTYLKDGKPGFLVQDLIEGISLQALYGTG